MTDSEPLGVPCDVTWRCDPGGTAKIIRPPIASCPYDRVDRNRTIQQISLWTEYLDYEAGLNTRWSVCNVGEPRKEPYDVLKHRQMYE